MNQNTPCETCNQMKCRTQSSDCFSINESSKIVYQNEETKEIAFAASRLIDNGRAGTLARVEEIIAYCKDRNLQRIGIANCFGLANEAKAFVNLLKENGLTPLPVTCTAGGVKEKEIDTSKTVETVSCNPAGQALVMNRLKPELVVEIGLCLGHDIIFHQQLEIPHTVLIVKDRVFAHDPASYFIQHTGAAEKFLKGIDDSFRMKSPDWLADLILSETPITILDVRKSDGFDKGHIKGSVNIPLRELPLSYNRLERQWPIICVCNGSVQSAYAVMYLSMKGFKEVYNLSGGFSRWQKERGELVNSPT